MERLISSLLTGLALCAGLNAQTRAVAPRGMTLPSSYSPGVVADGYLYVSNQTGRSADGTVPSSFAAQARLALDNIKGVVEAAGLSMEHVVYTHAYLADIANSSALDQVYAEYFPKAPPARALIGVARLPGGAVEISAVAVLDRRDQAPVRIPGRSPNAAFSAGMLTHDRLFISSLPSPIAGAEVDPGAEVKGALDAFKAVTEAAGLSLAHVVFVNPYLTRAMPAPVMNRLYAERFEFGNTPARATISVAALPSGNLTFTGVAVRNLAERRAVRPKNMPPSPTASPCVFAGNTLYCSAKSGFIPGPHSGIYAATVEHQLRQTMRNQLDNFQEADLDFRDVVAAQVYVDNLDDLPALNAIYGQYFTQPVKPAITAVQQVAPGSRKPDAGGRYPTLEQISFIAVRSSAR